MISILEPDFDKLAARLRQGDERAAGRIFDYFAPRVFGYLLAKTANRHLAEDLTQDVFLKVLTRIETFDSARGRFPAWLWGIARNVLFDHYRQAKATAFADLVSPEGELPEFAGPAETEPCADKFLAEKVWEVIRGFPEAEQEVLTLHYVSGLRYKEISQLTGRAEGSLRVLIYRLNRKIKDALDQ